MNTLIRRPIRNIRSGKEVARCVLEEPVCYWSYTNSQFLPLLLTKAVTVLMDRVPVHWIRSKHKSCFSDDEPFHSNTTDLVN
jgi:hypothetical protein